LAKRLFLGEKYMQAAGVPCAAAPQKACAIIEAGKGGHRPAYYAEEVRANFCRIAFGVGVAADTSLE